MARTDRAFRALAHAEPDVIAATLRVLAPDLVPEGVTLDTGDLLRTRLDEVPASEEFDWAASAGADTIVHIESQGYRDPWFTTRLIRYHLGLTLRSWPRCVRTVALWLMEPPRAQPLDVLIHGDLSVKVTSIVLARCSAAALLTDPVTACFAAGADPGVWTVDQLCARVAAALAASHASYDRRRMAAVAAASQRRYHAMVNAMENARLEPVIIEDLIHIGEDLGRAEGLAEGMALGRAEGKAEGEASALLRVCHRRGLALSASQIAHVGGCTDIATLERWLDRAVTALSADEVFVDVTSA